MGNLLIFFNKIPTKKNSPPNCYPPAFFDTYSFQTIWAAYTAVQKVNQKCWYGYNLTPYYWILEGPRLTVIIVSWRQHHAQSTILYKFISIFFYLTLPVKSYISTKYHSSSCCEAPTKPYGWSGASTESCESGNCSPSIVRNNKYVKYGEFSTRSFAFGICFMVVWNALFDVISRIFYSYDILFP